MSDDEIEIETLRYRAPVVVPLSGGGGGRFAVLCVGWEPPVRICKAGDLWYILDEYTQWNVLPDTQHVPKVSPGTTDLLASLGLEPDEIDQVLSTIIAKRTL